MIHGMDAVYRNGVSSPICLSFLTMEKQPPMLLDALGPRRLAAVKEKVRKLGTTADAYFKRLIDEDLELDHLVATRSLAELSSPIKRAFKNVSENEIGKMVEASRARHRRRLSK